MNKELMKVVRFVLFFSFIVFSYVKPSILEGATVYNYSPSFCDLGFDNCNMSTNGELMVIKSVIKSSDLVFDVGANKGEWSRNVFSVADRVTIYAFEPIPKVFEMLNNSFGGFNFFPCKLALSDFTGKKNFYYYSKNLEYSQLSGFYDRNILRENLNLVPEKIEVIVDTIGSFCEKNNIDHIDFLKIDTEGNELKVLLGAKDLLRDGRIPIIQFEYGGCYIDSETTLKQVYDLLTEYGYTLYRIFSDGLIRLNRWQSEFENYKYSNYLALLESKRKELLSE